VDGIAQAILRVSQIVKEAVTLFGGADLPHGEQCLGRRTVVSGTYKRRAKFQIDCIGIRELDGRLAERIRFFFGLVVIAEDAGIEQQARKIPAS
jgi:hypothetical protein